MPKTQKTIFLILLLAFLFSGLEVFAAPEDITVNYMNVDVAVVYYGITEEDLTKLQKGLEIAREFYWRNSGLQLNLNLIYILINEIVPPDSNSVGDFTIEKAINDAGYQISDFGGIFHISTDVDGTWSWEVHWNFDVGFSHSACVPYPEGCLVPTGVVYPGDDPSVNYGIIWIFTHEFQHALDEMYNRSGFPEMFHGDQPEAYAVRGGEQFSYQAEGLRRFNGWLGLATKWGTIEQFIDEDENGIPDNAPGLPSDDLRLGSGWDKEKYMAGIYQGSITGDLYNLPSEVDEFSPSIDGNIETEWTLLTNQEIYDNLDISSQIYSLWDTNNIYLAGIVNSPVNLHLWLDKDGDGWWNGRNNLELLFDISSNNIIQAHALDFSDAARAAQCNPPFNGPLKDDGLCGGIWDDDPNYPFTRIITPDDVEHSAKSEGEVYSFEIRIPTTALNGGQEIGYRIVFTYIGRATVFEDYELIYLVFAAAGPSTSCIKPPNWNKAGTCTVDIYYEDPTGGSGLAGCYYTTESGISPSCPTNGSWSSACSCSGLSATTCPVTISIGSTGNCDVNGEGACKICAKAVDVAGNVGYGEQSLNIDFAAPIVTVAGAPVSWQNSDATANVSCTDAHSGCDSATYKLKTYTTNPGTCSTTYTEYTPTSPQTISSRLWVCGTAKDNVGNAGFSSPVEFKIDKEKPVSQITSPPAGSTQTADFNVTVSDTDTGDSGINPGACYYRTYDSGVGWTRDWTLRTCNSTQLITVSPTGDCQTVGGTCTVYVYSYDAAGNSGDGQFRTFNISGLGPICNINVPDTGVINQWILINVSGSQGAITGVRFSSDNNLNGTPDGNWDPSPPNYYDWTVSSGNWDATNKTMKWSFAAVGNYEVWAEIKDSVGLTLSCHDTILIMECYPGQTKTCTSPQGCSHTLTCQANETWPSCPTDTCTANTQDTINCPCLGIDGCFGNDYYDFPQYGDCTANCTCNIGTAAGQPCAPTVYSYDSRCTYCGDGHCDPGETIWNCCQDCGIPGSGCDQNLRYWYTCEDIYSPTKHTEDCGTDSWTENYSCSGNYLQRQYCERGCQDSSCYENCYWLNWQDCDGLDSCRDSDYWDYSCSGNSCVSDISYGDSRCAHGGGGHDQCNFDADCDDGNSCTNNWCERPADPDSVCRRDNLAEGISCGICKMCDGNGNCVNRPDGYDTDECGPGYQRCVYGFCQDYHQACEGSEASCECRSDSCIDCSDYYDGGCGYQGICHCGPLERPVWSCSNWQCSCTCQYDSSCETVGECQRDYPDVVLSPLSRSGNPGDTLIYDVSVINRDLNCDPSIFSLTTGEYCDELGWTCSDLPDLTIPPGLSDDSTTLLVTSPFNASGGNYDVSVTAQNTGFPEFFGTGYTTYEVVNQPPENPGIPAEYQPSGVSWNHCSVQALSIPTFHWTYSDPEGNPQSAYEIRIDNDSDFSVVEDDEFTGSGGTSASYTPLPSEWRNWMNWDTDHWWIVKARDSQGNWSEWFDPTPFTTPLHAGPWPEFTPSPNRVSLNQVVTFEDNSVCYTSPGNNEFNCQDLVPPSYEWDFDYIEPTFTVDDAFKGNAVTAYSELGNYKIKLRITDDIDTCYSEIETVTVTLPLPEWMEIPPF